MAKKTTKKSPPKKAVAGSDLPPALQSKSATIETYLKAHPTAKGSEVVEALKAQGIEISTSYFTVVKSKLGLTKKRRKKRKTHQPAEAPSNGHVPDQAKAIEAAVHLFKAAGSGNAARAAIKLVENVAGILAK